ncbi:MAG: hypothetical protein IJD45_01250 [Clostridia bacterium]|nr:hypothetical protein [Clostridia bacterium]
MNNNNFDVVKGVLAEKGELVGTTSGKSMYPLFRNGKDRAVIVPLPQKLKVNDVLLYRKPATNEVILHRIIKFKDSNPILRGDNLYFNETQIPTDDILGVMKGFYRNGKYYECKKSLSYKLYVFLLRISYPIRYLFKKAFSLLKRIINFIKN